MYVSLLLSMIPFLEFTMKSSAEWMFQSEKKWDKEWKSGDWEYMEKVAVERSRIAVIGGVFSHLYAPVNASVLDVGCGEGAMSDFLLPTQKPHYVGMDISREAIAVAKSKRKPPLKFVHANVYDFKPVHKFDVIVFSDVLYYVEHEKIIKQYLGYLNPKGIMIISIFHETEKLRYEKIFQCARDNLELIDEIDVGGYTKKKESSQKEKTAFHIEVYRVK